MKNYHMSGTTNGQAWTDFGTVQIPDLVDDTAVLHAASNALPESAGARLDPASPDTDCWLLPDGFEIEAPGLLLRLTPTED